MDGEEVEKRLAYELEVNVRATFPQLISEDYDNGQEVSSSTSTTYPQCLDATFNIKKPFWRR